MPKPRPPAGRGSRLDWSYPCSPRWLRRPPKDHRADILGSGRLEEVRATSSAVAHVVADQVGDNSGVAGVVLRDASLDLTDEVGAHVGGLGVNATAKLREQRDKAGAEAKADDSSRRSNRQAARPPKTMKTMVTPSKLSAMTRKPETAPPRKETMSASPRPLRAAPATRILERTATFIPMKPAAPEQAAPKRKAMPERIANSW